MERDWRVLAATFLAFGPKISTAGDTSKVTLGYDHELRAEHEYQRRVRDYGPGGFSAGYAQLTSVSSMRPTGGCEIRSQVNDGPFKISPAGESFSEPPGDRHGVSANDSKTDPAKTTCGLHRQ